MKKAFFALMMSLCLLFACAAAEEAPFSLTVYANGGVMLVDTDNGTLETDLMTAQVLPDQPFGEVLELGSVYDVMQEGCIFAGWTVFEVYSAETADACPENENVPCLELTEGQHLVLHEYAICQDMLSTQELAELSCGLRDHVAVAGWYTEEEYDSLFGDEEIALRLPSVTLFCDEGFMTFDSDEGPYEASMSVGTTEPGKTIGELLEMHNLLSVTCEDKEFTGWTVYAVGGMDTIEGPVEEEGVLSYRVFGDYFMVLYDYAVTHELISTEELSQLSFQDDLDYIAIANFQ